MKSGMRDPTGGFREYMRLQRKQAGAGLTTHEFERWTLLKRALGRHFSPDLTAQQSDQRESVRVPTRLGVHFPTFHDLGLSLMTNLSRGGVFIATTTPCEIGTRLQLRIEVDETGDTLDVTGEVISNGGGASLQSEESGMGVRFHDLTEEHRKALDDLYEGIMRRAAKSEP